MKNANALAIDLIANEKANIWQNTKNNDSNTQRLCFHTALFHAVLISSPPVLFTCLFMEGRMCKECEWTRHLLRICSWACKAHTIFTHTTHIHTVLNIQYIHTVISMIYIRKTDDGPLNYFIVFIIIRPEVNYSVYTYTYSLRHYVSYVLLQDICLILVLK